jgi:hypothetical protein
LSSSLVVEDLSVDVVVVVVAVVVDGDNGAAVAAVVVLKLADSFSVGVLEVENVFTGSSGVLGVVDPSSLTGRGFAVGKVSPDPDPNVVAAPDPSWFETEDGVG